MDTALAPEIIERIVGYCLFSAISCTSKYMREIWYSLYPKYRDSILIPRDVISNYSGLPEGHLVILADPEQKHQTFIEYALSCELDSTLLIVKTTVEWRKWYKRIPLVRVMELHEYVAANPADLGYKKYIFQGCFTREAMPKIHPVHLETATIWLYKQVNKNSRPARILKQLKELNFIRIEFKSDKYAVIIHKIGNEALGKKLVRLYERLRKNPYLDSLEHKAILEKIHTDHHFTEAFKLIKYKYYGNGERDLDFRLEPFPDIRYFLQHFEQEVFETLKSERGWVYHNCRKPDCPIENCLINTKTGEAFHAVFESALDIDEIYYFGDPHPRQIQRFANWITRRKKPIKLHFWIPAFRFWKCNYVPPYM